MFAYRKRILSWFLLLQVLQGAIAFATAPYTCGWGSTAYVGWGICSGLIAMGIPYFQQRARIPRSWLWSGLFLVISLVIWVALFSWSGHRLLCRLF